ncbi:DUF397 domain-containing protein [Streptomyces acidiscabies]|uniref:DUF397 domain-containing protein n=1 Tax=Streptomyces acidiscabies TaxID=42234 RepID=UPI00073F0D77|nr:DUF397 domain-containing protein [Streptomyces acidiscabies]GAQ59297.1 hypothetical protein a10_09199 [Streptomyces acidiscabies]
MNLDLSAISWRKSSYSNLSSGMCLEVSADLLRTADWRGSSYCNQAGGQCLEFAPNLPSLVPVRDSKAPALSALLFTPASWNTFVDSVKESTR